MADLPPPSLPPSHPTYRHLGTAVVDRSVRVQMVIALIAGLIMIAVPLYLWRRPHTEVGTEQEARRPAAAASSVVLSTALDGPATSVSATYVGTVPGLLLGDIKTLKCGVGRMKTPPEQCDRQPYFESLLVKTLRESPNCIPEKGANGSVNLVLDIDHKAKKIRVWAGRTGTMKRAVRQKIAGCIQRAFTPPEWSQIIHQHPKYQLSLLATFPEPEPKTSKP